MKAHATQTSPAPASAEKGPDADRLILVNQDGHAQVANGGVIGLNRLMICDDNGKIFMDLDVHQGTPMLRLFHKGFLRATLGVIDDTVGLFLCDHKGAPKASLTVTADGSPSLSFHDAAGKKRTVLGLDHTGNGVLLLVDKNGAPRLSVMNTRNEPTLMLLNKKGQVVWEATAETAKRSPTTKARQTAPRRSTRPTKASRKGGRS